MGIKNSIKVISAKPGDLVWAIWYDYYEDEFIGGLGLVMDEVIHNKQKVLMKGITRHIHRDSIFDPVKGQSYFFTNH